MADRVELYARFHYLNFNAKTWHKAAERFLELREKIAELEEQDAKIDHDLFGDFESCEICEDLHWHRDMFQAFAEHFATIWAKQALANCEFLEKVAAQDLTYISSPDYCEMVAGARQLLKGEGK